MKIESRKTTVIHLIPLFIIFSIQMSCSDPNSAVLQTETPTELPAVPSDLLLTVGNNVVAMSWNTVENVDSYNIYRSLQQEVKGIKLTTTPVAGYTDFTATRGIFYYSISAVNALGESETSAQQSAELLESGIPSNLSAIEGDSLVTLSWTEVTSATGYNIYKSTHPDDRGNKINTSLIVNTAYEDSSVTNGVTYYYQVTAADANGEFAISSPQSARPTYPIGGTGPAGGIIVYDSVAASTGTTFSVNGKECSYIEFSPADLSAGIQWYNGTPVEITGAQNNTIGSGLKNTDAIISVLGNPSGTDYAANLCRNYTGGGKTDWYLPNSVELGMLGQFSYDGNPYGVGSWTYYATSSQLGSSFYVAHLELGQARFSMGVPENLYYIRACRAF